MDFFRIERRDGKNGPEVYPDFVVGRSNDLMVRGKAFYAVWDEKSGLWSRDEYDIQRIVDDALHEYIQDNQEALGNKYSVKRLKSFNSNSWVQFKKFMYAIENNGHPLDETITFQNTEVHKKDYVSKRLPYSLNQDNHSAWDELMDTLYSPAEREKIEWSIGSIIAGDSKKIQKFLVLYGPAGTGKSTVLSIIERLFEGYTTTFEAKALASSNNSFATEVFRHNPLVAIQHDGDLSRIEDNTKLNSIIAHEEMTMNEKYKPSYTARVNAFLFMGTNQPVRISDAKSGIIRRLIDVQPTGTQIPINHYHALMERINFELGGIAYHCLQVYNDLGKNYYNAYRPLSMMFKTDVFFNFIEANYDVFKAQDGTTLKQAYVLYKEYCEETGIDRSLPQYQFREELKNYFLDFKERVTIDGGQARSVYMGFNAALYKTESKQDKTFSLVMEETTSLFDREFEATPAQYANEEGTPTKRWDTVKTCLANLDTSQLHYVKVPENHIVIDFDLKDANGEKSLEQNLRVASGWPATYGEYSKSGRGIHLHYLYDGDVHSLAREYSEGIEVKVFVGNSSLRRQLTRCNNVPIATLKGGLPVKEQKVLDVNRISSEKGLRDLIERNLKKEIHPGTKPSIDFIHKILEDAYAQGLTYDVTDLRPRIIAFANNSSNQALTSLKIVQQMKFKSEGNGVVLPETPDVLVFFDVEVYPNLFIVCWKYQDSDTVVRMINPPASMIEGLFQYKLIGFNNRRYDNHILYARYLGYNNEQLYNLSQKIISGNVGAMFGEAYNISYTDIYDFSSKKQSLKKFQIEIEGLVHNEIQFPWDKPVPEEDWPTVEAYCVNDVLATEATFKDRYQDFVARQILAELSGLSVNETTQKHTAQIIFGNDRTPQKQFVYTDLSQEFPGYVFDSGVSSYRGESPGEGGYVYSEPGIYRDVALLDVASMHPTSIDQLNLFGDAYTARFASLTEARLAIKRQDYKTARSALGGKLSKFLDSVENDDHGNQSAKDLAFALKIVINIVYGLTSAKFDNAFRDSRNIDNIVAKRGALFMIDLKNYVQNLGFTVAHIKTDSIKIPNATQEIIDLVKVFGDKYGYTFEHETTYDALCLVNDAVYVARKGSDWTAVGAQFQHPYVFKTLFTHEDLVFQDLVETKQVVKGAIYLDLNYTRPMVIPDSLKFVGRIGQFVPVAEGTPASGILYRVNEGKAYALSGTKGYYWMEADLAKEFDTPPNLTYFERLVEDARKAISQFGGFPEFDFWVYQGE